MKNDKSLIIKAIKLHYGFKKDTLFADFLGIKPQTLNSWYSRKTFDYDLIYAKCVGISASYLLSGQGAMFETKEDVVPGLLNEPLVPYGKPQLPAIATVDENGNDNIVMVDVKAAAGYVTRHLESNYMQTLQAFKLPGPQFRNSTYRAFEVSGDSMFDTLYHGDWVICQHVDGFSNIREGYIHVIVTHEEVMVKRLLNRVEKRNVLILQSDNEAYPARELDAAEVQEIWLVKCFMGFNMPNRRIEVKKVLNDIQVKLLEHESRMNRMEKKK